MEGVFIASNLTTPKDERDAIIYIKVLNVVK